ncbi:hypothetical protein AB8E26_11555 [Stenotrophomonas rhizophila]
MSTTPAWYWRRAASSAHSLWSTATCSAAPRCRHADLGLRLTTLSPVGLRLLDPAAWVRG